MTITDRLKDKDPEVRAKAASDLAVAAAAVADAARTCRDRDASELLRLGRRPADVGRVVALHRAQMVRYKPGDAAPARGKINAEVLKVEQELTALLALLDAFEPVS